MTLMEFRNRFPGFVPGALVRHKGGPMLELVSWPYQDARQYGELVMVYARIPGDATTAALYDVRTLSVIQQRPPGRAAHGRRAAIPIRPLRSAADPMLHRRGRRAPHETGLRRPRAGRA
jgi:hypothetical protein